jgi:hypothetical protein
MRISNAIDYLTKPNKGWLCQGKGGGGGAGEGGLRVGVRDTPHPATFQPRSDHGRRPKQPRKIRKVAQVGHGACAAGVAHLLFDVRCRRSTTSTRYFLRMFRKSCLTWHLGTIGSSVHSSKKYTKTHAKIARLEKSKPAASPCGRPVASRGRCQAQT